MNNSEINNLKIRYEKFDPQATLKLKGKGYPSFDEPWNLWYPKDNTHFPSKYMSMYKYLVESTKNYLDEVALIYKVKGKDEKITYKELLDNIERCAKSFKMMGIKEGDIVTIMSLTTPEVIYSFYALSKIGAVTFMMDLRKGVFEYEKQLNLTESKTLLIPDFLSNRVKSIINNTGVENVITLPYISNMTIKEVLSAKKSSKNTPKDIIDKASEKKFKDISIKWKNFIKKGDLLFNNIKETEYKENKPALMILTSGTSGSPKIVVHAAETVNAMPQKYYKTGTFYAKPKEKMLSIMPPFLMYAVPLTFQTALTNGVTLVICPKADDNQLVELIEKHRPEYFIGATSHFYSMYNINDLSFAKFYGCGGDKVNKKVEEELKETIRKKGSDPVFIGYGATELGGSSATQAPMHDKIGTVGLPLYGNKVVVVDPENYEEKDYGEEGLLFWQNDTIMLEYYKNKEKTSQVLAQDQNGNIYFNSGDIGKISKDGELSVIGRIKPRAALFTGHKFSQDNITAVLLDNPLVKDCVTVAQKDTYHKLNNNSDMCQGYWPHSYIILNDNENYEKNIEEIKKWALNKLGEQDVPFFYTVVDKDKGFKLTINGKVDYRYYENEEVIISDNTIESNTENGILLPDYETLSRDAKINIGPVKIKKI